MGTQIIILPAVNEKLQTLFDTLILEGYFIYEDNALAYVDALKKFVQTIPSLRHRPTKNKKYGAWYCEYKPNKRTVWFVTFDKQGERYLIKNLINNHTNDYPTLI